MFLYKKEQINCLSVQYFGVFGFFILAAAVFLFQA